MWPAADRPYIGGSTNNSVLNLIINGNGYDRVFGTNSVAPPGVGAALSAPTSGTAVGGDDGLGRLFNSANGDQVSWLIPAALLALVLLVWLTARSPRTDRTRAALMLWGGWMLVTAASFSLISIHTYYTIALAPAIAALVGIGAVELWKRRTTTLGRFGLAGMIALTGMWSAVLLHRVSWQPWLIGAVIAAAVIATAAMLLTTTRSRQLTTVALLTAGITGLLGSGAYAVQTVANPRVGIGGLPVAGPGQDQRSINPFGTPPPGSSPATGAQPPAAGLPSPAGAIPPGGTLPSGVALPPGVTLPSGVALPPGETLPSGIALPPGVQLPPGTTLPPGVQLPPGGTLPSGGSAPGGSLPQFGNIADLTKPPGMALTALLSNTTQTWTAATPGAIAAASLQLAADRPVMAIGGFIGADPAPSLGTFQHYVSQGKIHYYVATSAPGASADPAGQIPAAAAGTAGGAATSIADWVQATYTPTIVDGRAIYDLTAPPR